MTATTENNVIAGKKVIAEAVRIGVNFNAEGRKVTDIAQEFNKRLRVLRSTEWELGYLTLSLFRKAPWREGVNGVPTWADFIRYLETEQRIEVGEDHRRIREMMEVYVAWSRYKDDYVVGVIKDIGITKPHIAIPYLKGVEDIERARKIIDLCREHSAKSLRDAIKKLLGRGGIRGGGGGNPDERSANAIIKYLAENEAGIVGNKLFIPRRDAQEYHVEAAWHAVFMAAEEELGLQADALFAHIMKTFAKTLDPNVIENARISWKTVLKFQKIDTDQLGWLYDDLERGEESETDDEA